MNRTEAQEFFRQLREFSAAYLARLGLPPQAPWRTLPQDPGSYAPLGAILHYTASSSLTGTLRWFCQESFNAKASAHVVIHDRRSDNAEDLVKQWPLVNALPVTVVQCVRPEEQAWHATWTNGFTYGIENVNAGELRLELGTHQLMHWPPKVPGGPEWTTPWKNPGGKDPLHMAGRIWDNYPVQQVEANIAVLRAVNALFGGSLQAPWVLGHEQVQGKNTAGSAGSQKRDPGPTFPLANIRAAVFSGEPGNFLELYDASPSYMDQWRDSQVLQDILALTGLPETIESSWRRFDQAMRVQTDHVPTLRIGMKLLGYYTESGPTWTPNERLSINAFQKLMGMKADGIMGPLTRAALTVRLVDRGLLPDLSKG